MTGLEPATSGVTGRCSNQLSYIPKPSWETTCVKLDSRFPRLEGCFSRKAVLLGQGSPLTIPDCSGRARQHQVRLQTASREKSGSTSEASSESDSLTEGSGPYIELGDAIA
jgi:hypothetical protein